MPEIESLAFFLCKNYDISKIIVILLSIISDDRTFTTELIAYHS